MPTFPSSWSSLTVAFLATCASACSSGAPTPQAGASTDAGPSCPTTTAEIQRDILTPRCGLSGCHSGDQPAQDLDLSSPDLESRIDDLVGACGRPIVTPGKPRESYLITKVSLRSPSCGVGMPFDGTPLSARDVSCLTEWVAHLGPAPAPTTDGAPPASIDASTTGAGGSPGIDGGSGGSGSGGAPAIALSACPAGKMRCGTLCIATVQPTFDSIYAGILARSCVFDSCHGGTAPKEKLSFLDADDAFADLVGVPSAQRPDVPRVAPSHPESSYIVDKLHGLDLGLVTTTGLPSEPMPLPPSKPLCAAKIAVIEEWIASGASR